MMNLKNVAFMVLVLNALFSAAPSAQAAGTPISYQGSLDIAGAAANGLYDFRAVLYDSLEFGDQASPVLVIDDVDVVEGLVNLELDFGANAFNGEARFLQLEVRDGVSGGGYTILQPRQKIYAAPQAINADALNGDMFQRGTIGTCESNGSAGAVGSVTYDRPFASTPLVFLTIDESFNNAGCLSVRLFSRTAMGFSFAAYNSAANLTACDCIHWLAIGEP